MIDWTGPLETVEENPRRIDLKEGKYTSILYPQPPIYWVYLEGSDDPDSEGWFANADGSEHLPTAPYSRGLWVRNRETKSYSDAEKFALLKNFLVRVSGYGGPIELSYMKVEGEYRYFHKKARELLRELFPLRPTKEIEQHEDDLDF